MSWSAPSWADVKAAWSSGWKSLSEQATRAYATAAQVDPTGTLARVQAFVSALADSRAALDRMAARIPNPPATAEDQAAYARLLDLERRYRDLAAGLYADAKPAGTAPPAVPEVCIAPVVLVVGGLAVGAVGVAWALAAYEYAVNLREQTALAERELDARVTASREGRALQPTTLPAQPSPIDTATSTARRVGTLVVGGLVVVAGAILLPTLLRK